MKKIKLVIILLFLMVCYCHVFAQAPVISYSTPKTYAGGSAITPLTPTSTGVAAPSYSTSFTTVGAGLVNESGMAIDAAGNLYVADRYNSVVKKFTPGSTTPTIIGTGFLHPIDVKVDAAGNVFVADYAHSAIKEVLASNGSTITLGSGFSYPAAIALDRAGDLYIADAGNNAVKVLFAGTTTPVNFGSGFFAPFGIALDSKGNVYVADGSGAIIELPAIGGPQVAVVTGLSNPNGIAIDADDNLFIADSNNGIVKELPAGSTTIINLNTTSTGLYGVAVDAVGNLYVSNYDYPTIYKYAPLGGYYLNKVLPRGLSFNGTTGAITGTPIEASPATNYTVTAYNASGPTTATVNIKVVLPAAATLSYSTPQTYVSGSAITPLSPTKTGVAPLNYNTAPLVLGSGFNLPEGVAVDAAGNVYVADALNNVVKKIPAGNGTPVVVASGFNLVTDVAIDKAGNLYANDYYNNEIKEFTVGSTTPIILGSGFYHPYGVAVDAAGNVYVGDQGNNMVKKIPAGNGPVVTLASGLYVPDDLCVDAAGNVYFADLGNNAIKKIPVGGGAPVIVGSGFVQPLAVAVDAAGNLFVTDRNNNAIKEIYAGTNTTVTISAGFNFPFGICVDNVGDIFVGDFGNNQVKEIKPVGGYFINALPPGLNFSEATGTFSGTPAVVSPATNYTVTAYNLGGRKQTTVNFAVTAPGSTALSALTTSSGALNPIFAAGTTSYAVSVANAISSIKVTPTTAVGTSTVIVNGKAVVSGTASTPVLLSIGINTFNVVVTASGGTPISTYTLVVTRQLPNNDNLSALSLSTGTLSPVFAAGTLTYKATVPTTTASVTVTPTTALSSEVVTVNGTLVASGAASAAIALNYGVNTIKTLVTAPDGVTSKTYTLTVTRTASANANLSAIKLTPTAALTVVSGPDYKDYTASVNNATTSIQITATAAVTTSTIKVNGTTVASGVASAAIPLNIGPNVIIIAVTAQNGSTINSYVITVTRALSPDATLSALSVSTGVLSPAFAAATTSYTAKVANSITGITVTPTSTNTAATVTVNGIAVTSGTASGTIALNTGPNTITTVVTAQDGVTTKTYTITVTRALPNNANLSNLTLSAGALTPVFATATTSYTISVANAVASVTLTPKCVDPLATVKVNGTAVASGSASGGIALNLGNTVITTVVTAQNGTITKTYTITVTRAATIANLSEVVSVSNPTEHPQMMGEEIMVHQGLSPNGDGINDFLLIDGITAYPNNKLQIMNRTGQLIFEAKGYDNSTRVFDGHSNKNGAMQLPGTYFYSLDYTDQGVTKHKTGYIILKY